MATKPKIVATPSRGNYTVKGTPKGVVIPKAPTAGSVVQGKQGVDFVYRPSGPKGPGYYRKEKPTPSITTSKPTVGTNAAGSTIATPPTTNVAAPPPAPRAAFNYADAFYAAPGYSESLAGINQQLGGIESKYGFTIRRDVNPTSPTRGGAYYKPKGAPEGSGTILATVSPVDGSYVYKDSAGKVYSAADLEIDVVTLKPGDVGYLEGAYGSNAATSDLNMRKMSDAAAQSGVGASGIRGAMASQEGAARAARNFSLTAQAGADLGATTAKYVDLYRTIFDSIKGQAEDYNSAPVPAPEAPAAEAPAPAAPEYLGYNQAPPPPPGRLSGGPGGQFMTLIADVTLERNTTDKAIREGLRAFLKNPAYQLTAQQKAYINSLITGRYKGNKKY